MKQQDWITDKMPEERESIFLKFKGSLRWNETVMWEKCSKTVLITIEHGDKRIVSTGATYDGKWKNDYLRYHNDAKVVAWMPYPEPYLFDFSET